MSSIRKFFRSAHKLRKLSSKVKGIRSEYNSILLLGTTAPVGFSGNCIVFQFIKPCFGFFVIKLKNEAEEVKKLRDLYKKDKNVKKIK
jgi:hypothetical protein